MRIINLLVVALLTCSLMMFACESKKSKPTKNNKPSAIENLGTDVEDGVDSAADEVEEETGIQKDLETL